MTPQEKQALEILKKHISGYRGSIKQTDAIAAMIEFASANQGGVDEQYVANNLRKKYPDKTEKKTAYWTGVFDAIEFINESLSSHLQPVTDGWISVEERLPEVSHNNTHGYSDTVMLWTDNPYAQAYRFGTYNHLSHKWSATNAADQPIFDKLNFTHWMPLPKQPTNNEKR